MKSLINKVFGISNKNEHEIPTRQVCPEEIFHFPKKNSDLRKYDISIDDLLPNEIEVLYPTEEQLIELLRQLSRDKDAASISRLHFVRSARVYNYLQFLLFSYIDLGGRQCYLTCCRNAVSLDQEFFLSLTNYLTPEQYIFAYANGKISWNCYEITIRN